jgi:hypothetical protein
MSSAWKSPPALAHAAALLVAEADPVADQAVLT